MNRRDKELAGLLASFLIARLFLAVTASGISSTHTYFETRQQTTGFSERHQTASRLNHLEPPQIAAADRFGGSGPNCSQGGLEGGKAVCIIAVLHHTANQFVRGNVVKDSTIVLAPPR
jgi:hypothetical protein